MHIAEIRTVAKLLPLLRENTHKSLILSYSEYLDRIFHQNTIMLLPQQIGADIAAAGDRNDMLLFLSCQILDGVNRPTGNFSDICTDRGDIAQQEEGCKR